jgi:RNA polymerase sigma-70 factor (ECF subfamily)
MTDSLPKDTETAIDALYERCVSNAPNFGVQLDFFKGSVTKSLGKFISSPGTTPTDEEISEFISQLQADDLFLALACANGNERAWWEFDQSHRSYMERVARHLAKTDIDATDIVDTVYEQLYGTRIVDGERVSKFSTYSGRGSLRGWLRTVIWHSLVDLHRASHDDVSLDEMVENVGEGAAHANFADLPNDDSEAEVVDQITQNRYRSATLSSVETAFASLADHERLLLLYYHVENMKLREIARLVENEGSPLRGWFQRRSQSRETNPTGRIHESTIMRWLEKSYKMILERFREELVRTHGLQPAEVDICMELATRDLAGKSLFRNLSAT